MVFQSTSEVVCLEVQWRGLGQSVSQTAKLVGQETFWERARTRSSHNTDDMTALRQAFSGYKYEFQSRYTDLHTNRYFIIWHCKWQVYEDLASPWCFTAHTRTLLHLYLDRLSRGSKRQSDCPPPGERRSRDLQNVSHCSACQEQYGTYQEIRHLPLSCTDQ